MLFLNLYRIIFAELVYLLSKNKDVINADIDVFAKEAEYPSMSIYKQLACLLICKKEFRNLFFYRTQQNKALLRLMRKICKVLFPELESLIITTPKIGKGLLIKHGISTIISAKEIGEYCTVFQQTTIGYNGKDAPIIGSYVIVYCGAKVLGGINVGNNVTIGANAVVIRNIPDNCVAVGVPARVLER